MIFMNEKVLAKIILCNEINRLEAYDFFKRFMMDVGVSQVVKLEQRQSELCR